MPRVIIAYVDGEIVNIDPSEWADVRGEGVDRVGIGWENFTWLNGHSIYWLYHEDKNWVLGGGPVGYGQLPPEILVGVDDNHGQRAIKFMPDLLASNIKLGWWWPGTSEPIDA